MSNKAANEQIIIDAGLSSRKLVSNPRAYFEHKIVSSTKAPPDGIPPSRNESPNDRLKIHRISVTGILRLEYERQIKIKEIVVTNAEPPRAKIANIG